MMSEILNGKIVTYIYFVLCLFATWIKCKMNWTEQKNKNEIKNNTQSKQFVWIVRERFVPWTIECERLCESVCVTEIERFTGAKELKQKSFANKIENANHTFVTQNAYRDFYGHLDPIKTRCYFACWSRFNTV